jgi:hypothetical protein
MTYEKFNLILQIVVFLFYLIVLMCQVYTLQNNYLTLALIPTKDFVQVLGILFLTYIWFKKVDELLKKKEIDK